MERFLNALKGHSAGQDAAAGQCRLGIVASVDAAAATARVVLQPEGVLSGWLPVLAPWVGAGWGLYAPPSPGDQVLVVPQEGDAQNGLVVARGWTRDAPPPATPPGELWLVHRTGSAIKLANDGTVQVKGDLHVDGDVYDRHGALNTLRGHYNQHTHPDPHGGQTGRTSLED